LKAKGIVVHEEERIIYMIKPRFLLQDLLRAFEKLGLNPRLTGEKTSWLLEGSSGDRRARVELISREEVVKGLDTLGPIPVSVLSIHVEGPEDFITAFKHRIEVELLRCLG